MKTQHNNGINVVDRIGICRGDARAFGYTSSSTQTVLTRLYIGRQSNLTKYSYNSSAKHSRNALGNARDLELEGDFRETTSSNYAGVQVRSLLSAKAKYRSVKLARR